ncbi:hypothetical protein BIU82_03845 [Arthrobacter sp. SW1]|uniref:hypothetical protein n=1 Tax=Arthrobacter sp. SW1 TaxID=1920889 RepID=UPI000877CF3C|nr:hypothetical protein [Arthrobacter sp. SW1]OFI38466.1 hypothetical protein BIU82_03845 [Arthrobacter sp. SW1]
MEKRESSAAAIAAFEELGADLLDAGVVAGQMFGARSLLLEKKAIACLNGDLVAFKLGRDTPEHARALALPGAVLFDPSGMGRPFKDWVEVPLAASAEWPALADAALANARR